MVAGLERLARRLGGVLIGGAFGGVALALAAVVVLAATGRSVADWPLSLSGWWSGDGAGLRFVAGAGIVLLGATPVIMLLVFGVQAARQRHRRGLAATLALAAVLTAGVWLALQGSG
jgi:hypothetical protein